MPPLAHSTRRPIRTKIAPLVQHNYGKSIRINYLRSRLERAGMGAALRQSALNMKTMKILPSIVLVALASNLFAGTCDDSIAQGRQGGTNPMLLTLQPGVTQDVYWDFTQCTFGIQNFTIYVTQPRNKNGFQPSLKPGTPLQVETTNLTTDVSAYWPGFICYMGTVSSSHVLCSLTLSASARRPIDVEVSYSAAFGGMP
jgi:hypothetical protein